MSRFGLFAFLALAACSRPETNKDGTEGSVGKPVVAQVKGSDTMVNLIASEVAEAVSNPQLNAWDDALNEEMGQRCAWLFVPVYNTSNGQFANVHLGAHDYMVQNLWINDGPYSGCGLHWGTTPTPSWTG